MTTTTTTTQPTPDLPPFERFLEVASDRDSWTTSEESRRSGSPRWLIREAEAHITLSLLHDDSTAIRKRLQAAVRITAQLPNETIQQSASDYLRTLLPAHHRNIYDELLRDESSVIDDHLAALSPPERVAAAARGQRRSPLVTPNIAIALLVLLGCGLFLSGFVKPWFQGHHLPQASVLASLTLSGLSKGGDETTVHSLDKYVFEAKSRTTLPFGWLIAIDDEAAMLRQFSTNSGSEILLTHRGQFDVRECYESFVVILADSDFEPLHDADAGWLSADRIAELQRTVQGQSNATEARAVIEQALRHAGLSGNVHVTVSSYQHLYSQRPSASDGK